MFVLSSMCDVAVCWLLVCAICGLLFMPFVACCVPFYAVWWLLRVVCGLLASVLWCSLFVGCCLENVVCCAWCVVSYALVGCVVVCCLAVVRLACSLSVVCCCSVSKVCSAVCYC